MCNSEFAANQELAQSIVVMMETNELMNERKPISFEEPQKPVFGDTNDSSTWELV